MRLTVYPSVPPQRVARGDPGTHLMGGDVTQRAGPCEGLAPPLPPTNTRPHRRPRRLCRLLP